MTTFGSGDHPLQVVLADDSGIFRRGLRLLLEAVGVSVLADVGDVPGLLDAVSREAPDVALVDIRMPPTHTDEGVLAAARLVTDAPRTGVLLLSTYVEARHAGTLLDLRAGGLGYLLKDRVDDVDALLDALRRVAAGGIALDPEVVASLVSTRRHTTPLQRLTERELQVLGLLAEGRSNAGIAAALFLSVKTVEMHVASVFRALDLDDAVSDNRRVKAALAFLAARPA